MARRKSVGAERDGKRRALTRFTFLFGSPQLRGHEGRLIMTAHGTPISLSRPTVLH
jgi:hypothetical protein